MGRDYIVKIAAITAIACMVIVAVLKGIDSELVMFGIIAVSGLAGFILTSKGQQTS